MPEYTDEGLPIPEPTKREKPKPTLPCPDPVVVPAMVHYKPSVADIFKMGAYRFARGAVSSALGAAVALGAAGIRGTALAIGVAIGGLLGGVGLGIDKIIREEKNGKKIPGLSKADAVGNLIVSGGSAVIRTEVEELSVALAKLGKRLADDVPNKEEWTLIAADVFGVIMEGKDFAGVPKEERLKAIAHAFIKAGADVVESAMKYSDETV